MNPLLLHSNTLTHMAVSKSSRGQSLVDTLVPHYLRDSFVKIQRCGDNFEFKMALQQTFLGKNTSSVC